MDFNLNVDLQTAWTVSFWTNVALIGLLLFINWRSGCYVWAAIKAWWKKTGIAMEWMKTGKYRYYAAPIPKEFPEIIEKSNDAGVIEIKRRHNGYDENGNQIFMFSTEHGITYNPEVITGERYFTPIDYGYYLYNAESKQWEKQPEGLLSIKHNPDVKFFARYPAHTVNPTEFVQHQKNNLNPTVIAGALKYREMAVKRALQNPFGTFIQQNGAWLIGFMVIAWLIMTWMNNNNQAREFQGKFETCQQQLYSGGYATTTTLAANINPKNIPSGGALIEKTTTTLKRG